MLNDRLDTPPLPPGIDKKSLQGIMAMSTQVNVALQFERRSSSGVCKIFSMKINYCFKNIKMCISCVENEKWIEPPSG